MGCMNKISALEIEKKIAILMLTIGLAMMFLIPTWQTPDEYTHLKLIGTSINNEKYAEIIANSVNIDGNRIYTQYDEKVDTEELKEAIVAVPDYNKKDLMPQGISLSILKHLPAALGIFLGIILGLPAYWILQFGELVSLFFYVFVCYRALKIMPMKKELFAMIMLMPMALQQAGGIGYDSVLIPLCFYWFAYVFYLKVQEKIEIKDFLKLIALWLLITYIKIPYCFIILLIFIFPLDKIHLQIGKLVIDETTIKKHRILIILLGIIGSLVGLYVLRNNFWVQLVIGLMKEWRQTLHLLKETGKVWHEMLITSSVGNFGWLDTPIHYGVAIVVYIIIAAVSIVNSDEKDEKFLKKRDVFVIWGTAFVLCIFTAFAMVNHTITVTLYGFESDPGTYDIQSALYQIPYIGGLQGRYFLPFVSLFFLPLPQLKQADKKKTWIVVSVFEIIMFIYVIYILLCRYWIA